MLNFQKDKLALLETLRDIVTENMDNASINSEFEQDVSEFLTEVKDHRRVRKLKLVRNALDEFIDTMILHRKLKKAELKHNEENRIKTEHIRNERVNEHQ